MLPLKFLKFACYYIMLLTLLFYTKIKAQPYDNFGAIVTKNAIEINPHFVSREAKFMQEEKIIDPGKFQIIGIGEQSHGTSEFFHARTSLIKLLASKNQITKIGLEAPMAEVDLLNHALTGKSTDMKQLLKSFRLYGYECDEFVQLTEAVRLLNLNRAEKLRFFGFDAQSPFQALENMLTFSQKTNKSLADSLKKLINNYQLLDNEIYSHSFSTADFDELNALSQYVFNSFDPFVKSKPKSDLIVRSIENYRQFLQINNPHLSNHDLHLQSRIRDSIMAVNVLEQLSSNDKLVVLAHNGHVQKTANPYSKSMGSFLSEKLGDNYKCMAMTTSRGFYTGFNPKAGKIIATNAVLPGDQDTFEFYFSLPGKPVLFIESDKISRQAGRLTIPEKYRLLPYGSTDHQFVTGNILNDFDFILHIHHTKGNKSFYLN